MQVRTKPELQRLATGAGGRCWSLQFVCLDLGQSGAVTTDDVGDKIPVYPCWQYDPDADEFVKWAHIDMSKPQGQVKQAK